MRTYEKTGHKKDGYFVVKVYEGNPGETPNFIGFAILDPDGKEIFFSTDEAKTLEKLEELTNEGTQPQRGNSFDI